MSPPETSFPRNLSYVPCFLSTRPKLFINSLWVPGAPWPCWGRRRQAQWLFLFEMEVIGADKPQQGAPSTSEFSGYFQELWGIEINVLN